MREQFIMKRTQRILLTDKETVDKLNEACDRMEELTKNKWSVNKWLKKNAEIDAKKGQKND